MEDIKDRDAKFDGVSMVIIVCSTTGEGDPPDNASRLYRRLKSKKHGADHLAHIKYTVLGLGDTNYSDFCTSSIHTHTHTHTHTHINTRHHHHHCLQETLLAIIVLGQEGLDSFSAYHTPS